MAESSTPPRDLALPKPPGHPHRPTPPASLDHHHHVSTSPEPKKPAQQHRSQHHNGRRHQHRSCCNARCVCCLWAILFILILLTLLALTSAIIYASIRPLAPEFRIERLNVTSLSLATRSDRTFLTSAVDLSLEAMNRNDLIRFRYDRVRVGVFAGGDVLLGRAQAPAFAQGNHSVRMVRLRAGVSDAAVEPLTGRALSRRFKDRVLEVDVRVDGLVDAAIGEWHTGSFPIKAECNNIQLSRISSGLEPKCSVYLDAW